ncbi:MAG: hypothetical protein NTW69_15595 [Chloroflexi bacterium]|nr:hypothetical protein [Chloroflexota bacterium]
MFIAHQVSQRLTSFSSRLVGWITERGEDDWLGVSGEIPIFVAGKLEDMKISMRFEADILIIKVWGHRLRVKQFFGDAKENAPVSKIGVVRKNIEIFEQDLIRFVFEITPLISD